jgi:metallo-beta-lactamase class B
MKKRLMALLLCLAMTMSLAACGSSDSGSGSAGSADPGASTSEPLAPGALDTEEIKAELAKAEELAGDDASLQVTQLQQCKMLTEKDANKDDPVEPIQLFDNLYFFGTKNVGVFVFTTPEGYIMIDSGFSNMTQDVIIAGMEEMNLDPAQVKYILVTHAGPDHIGGAYYFQQTYGTRVVMSEEEWANAPTAEENAARYEATQAPDFVYDAYDLESLPWPNQDIVGKDGDTITLGDLSVTVVECPRRTTGGGLSYIAPVYDNGEEHMWATYGNTNTVGSLDDLKVYRESVTHFLSYVNEMGVDVIISNHPFVDGSVDVMDQLRNRAEGDPNPFVVGNEKVNTFLKLLDQSCAVIAARVAAGLNEYGNAEVEEGYEIGVRPSVPAK